MTIAEVEATLKRIKYKPNFKIEVEQQFWNSREVLQLKFTMMVPDATWKPHDSKQLDDPPTIPIISVARMQIEAFRNPEEYVSWVRFELQRLEMHELNEWFRLDGELVVDPHKDDLSRL